MSDGRPWSLLQGREGYMRRAFIVVDVGPFEHAHQLVDRARHQALLVRVLDANDESAVGVLPCQQEVVQCRPQSAQVDGARGRGRIAHAYWSGSGGSRGGKAAATCAVERRGGGGEGGDECDLWATRGMFRWKQLARAAVEQQMGPSPPALAAAHRAEVHRARPVWSGCDAA